MFFLPQELKIQMILLGTPGLPNTDILTEWD